MCVSVLSVKWGFKYFRAVVLNRGWFCSQEKFNMSADILGWQNWGEGYVTGIKRVDATDASKHPVMHCVLVAHSCPTLYNPWTAAHLAFCPWDLPGKDTGVVCHFLLQGIFLTQRSNRVSCTAGRFFTEWATRDLPTIQNIPDPNHSAKVQKHYIMAQFSCSVVPNSLQSHGLQHTMHPCPSPTPRAYSNSCPSSQWCHPTISSSVILFSSCLQSFLVSGSFQVSQILHIRWPKYQSFSFSISPSNEYLGLISFRMDWLDLLSVQGTQESSPTPQFKSINSSRLSCLYGPIDICTWRPEKPYLWLDGPMLAS